MDFSLLHSVQIGSETYLAGYPMDAGAFFSVIKRPALEADHSHASSSEVRNYGAVYTFTPPYVSMARFLIS
jgi:hypothetical protein